MGEAKRRKNIDPNYGKPQHVNSTFEHPKSIDEQSVSAFVRAVNEEIEKVLSPSDPSPLVNAQLEEQMRAKHIHRLRGYLDAASQLRELYEGASFLVEGRQHDVTGELRSLLEIVCSDTEISGSGRTSFLGQHKDLAKQVGQALEEKGGLVLMSAVMEQIPELDQRLLDYAWDGIGDWMA